MITHLIVSTARQTCSACPDQWEGELIDGRLFYFRYRCGEASIAVGSTREQVDGRQHVTLKHGDSLDGAFKDDAERNAVFADLVTIWLDS